MEKIIKIVLIDDDTISRRQIAEYFREAAMFKVKEFSRGEKAIEFLRDNQAEYTAVIMDYVLTSSMTGDELLKQAQQDIPYLPFIVISGRDLESNKTLTRGAYATMQKPLNFAELELIIREIAEQDTLLMSMAKDIKETISIKGFDTCCIWTLERKKHHFRIEGWAGRISNEYRQSVKLKISDLFKKEKFLKSEPVLISDINTLEKSNAFQHCNKAISYGWKALITIPLVYKKKIIGIIDCYNKSNFEFEDAEQKRFVYKALQTFATQAVKSIRSVLAARQAHFIREINQEYANTLNEDLILDSILSKGMELSGAEMGWIYAYDSLKEKLIRKKYKGKNAGHLEKELAIGEGVSGMVARTGQLRVVEDTENSEFKRIVGVSVSSLVGVPLKHGKQNSGALVFASSIKGYFMDDDADYFISLAAMATAAIEQSKLTKHLQQASNMAVSGFDHKKLSEYVVEAVYDLMGVDVNFWELSTREDEGYHNLRIGASQGEFLDDYKNRVQLSAKPGSCVVARALKRKTYVIVNNIEEEKEFFFKEEAKRHGWYSYMAVPLLGAGKESIGALTFYGKMYNRFDEENGKLMQTFANNIAFSLQQQKRVWGMEQLAKVGQKLGVNAQDTRELLEKIAKIAKELTEADCVVIYPYDSIKKDFFNKEMFVGVGLRKPDMDLGEKPRIFGFAAEVRKHKLLIIDDVNKIKFRKDPNSEQPLLINERKRIQRILTKKPKLIGRENIQAFLCASLSVQEHSDINSTETNNLGVIYFNYRYPREFTATDLEVIRIFVSHISNAIHSNWLFEKSQRQNRELEAIHDFTLDIVSHRKLKDRLQNIVEKATELLKGKGGKVYLRERGEKVLKLVAANNVDAKVLPIGTILPFGKGMAGKVIEQGKTIIESNYSQWEGRIENYDKLFTAVIETPLFYKDDPIGVIAVFEDKEKRQFNEDDKQVLERLAQQASLAIHNARLYDEFDSLYKTGLNISRQVEIKKVTKEILDELGKVIEYDKATIQLIQELEQPRILLDYRGFDENGINEKLLNPVAWDKLTKHIVDSKKPLLLSNAEKSDFWEITEQTKDVRSWAGIPLVYRNKTVGLLTLDHQKPGYYQESDKILLSLFANQAASAIHNAQLFESLDNKTKQLEELHKAGIKVSSHRVNSKEDLKEVLNSIVESVKGLFNAGSATIFPYNSLKNEFWDGVRFGLGAQELEAPSKLGVAFNIIKGLQSAFKSEKDLENESPIFIAGEKSLSHAHIPLVFDGEGVGVLFINYFSDHHFSKEERNFLELFAQQAAIAIYNTQIIDAQKQRIEKLEELDKRKSEFISTVSHELRTPLTPIKSCLQNFLAGTYGSISEKQRIRLEIALNNVDDETRIVENLLNLVHIQENRVHFDPEKICFIDIVKKVVQRYEYDAAKKEIKLETNLPKTDQLLANLDRVLILSVLSNLVHNSIKYTQNGGSVSIWVKVVKDFIKVNIIDTGIGIPESEKEKIFDRFFQVDSSLTRKVGGVGIGLNIVKNFIEIHGGSIDVESKLGKGSTFSFSLPMN